MAYLYTKETKSSFEIEAVKPISTRIEKFVSLLRAANDDDFLLQARLVELQNAIVDSRYADKDYRTTQNYVGESSHGGREVVHYVSPKPEDICGLMDGW